MAASVIDILREESRQALTGDDRYFKKDPYAFVLNGPSLKGSLGFFGRAVFPLPLNPETFEYSMPFAAEITPLQEGGIVAEEGGITVGELTIEGTTGWKLRAENDTSFGPGDGEFTGQLATHHSLFQDISGQMHFWRLANRCFDAYSSLKKDASTSSATSMEFHSIKDDLHLTVIPREFSLRRGAARERVTYRYVIRCAVIGPASNEIHIPSPDVGLLQSFKNSISKIRTAVQSISAAVDDITAAIDEIRRTITGIAGILDDVARIVDSFTDLINGVKAFADIPKAFINGVANLLESAANLAGTVASFPADVAQSFRGLADDLDRLATSSASLFRETFDEVAKKYEKRSTPPRLGDDATRDSAASSLQVKASAAGGTLKISEVFGGAVKPGDVARARIAPPREQARLGNQVLRGFEERVVGQGDTLQSLAARYLGNAREWLTLAIINGLKAPYITNGAKIPGTLQVGGNFIIPTANTSRSPDTITTGEAEAGESQASKHLGKDFELVQAKNAAGALSGTFAWAIDIPGGSTDVRKVEGIKNIGQAIESRFRTERGTNILYPGIGLPRLVGSKGVHEEVAEARHEARRQLLADIRIEHIASFRFTQEEDRLVLTADVQPKGFNTTRTISRTLT